MILKENLQNKYINKIINKTTNVILYTPYNINKEIVYTNIILQKIIGDIHFEYSKKINNKNSFGEAQYYNNKKFSFEKIEINNKWINIIKNTPYENAGITNLWIVIDNPTNLKLNDLVDNIRLCYGGMLYQSYCTSDIENEINILSYIFNVTTIKYENKKIYIPLIIPYNSIILNNGYYAAEILVTKNNIDGTRTNVICEIYGNIIDTNVIYELENTQTNREDVKLFSGAKEKAEGNTNNVTHNFSSIFYQTQFICENIITINKNNVKLYFLHPTYVLYIMNISKEYVTSIKLFINTNVNDYFEYKLNDIEWFDNHAIIWFNRKFLLVDELNTNLNFSCCIRPYLIIENTYYDDHKIEIIALNFNVMNNFNGMSSLIY